MIIVLYRFYILKENLAFYLGRGLTRALFRLLLNIGSLNSEIKIEIAF